MVEYYQVGLDRAKYGYDGWSELNCNDCKARIGRWSEKELGEGELEPRWGNTG